MTAQNGRDFVLKDTDQNGTTLAGMRVTSFTLDNEQVDITNKDSNAWRELLEGAGVKSLNMSVEGVFKDSAIEETVRGYAFANSINPFALVFGNGDYLTGNFAISSYERAGAYNGEETYTMSFQSSGAITYTSA